MAVMRPGKALRCSGCGKTGAEKQGVNNWKMCDTCFMAYCYDCYHDIKRSASDCTEHNPWGKWLTGDGAFGTMTFK